jgi:hypothetical protein
VHFADFIQHVRKEYNIQVPQIGSFEDIDPLKGEEKIKKEL